MKKLSFILVMTFIITTIFSANVAALNVGDKLGNVLYTDIKAYINGERIPCYNVDGNIAVMVSDLNNYGFDTSWNAKERTTTIKLNTGKNFTPLKVDDNTKEVGSVAFPYVYTDIQAIVNGSKVDSYNINGNLCISMRSLSAFGEYVWDGKARTVNLTINNIAQLMSNISWDGKAIHFTAVQYLHFVNISFITENGNEFGLGNQKSYNKGDTGILEINTKGEKVVAVHFYLLRKNYEGEFVIEIIKVIVR